MYILDKDRGGPSAVVVGDVVGHRSQMARFKGRGSALRKDRWDIATVARQPLHFRHRAELFFQS